MSWFDDALASLSEGQLPGALAWRRVRRSCDPALIDALAGGLPRFRAADLARAADLLLTVTADAAHWPRLTAHLDALLAALAGEQAARGPLWEPISNLDRLGLLLLRTRPTCQPKLLAFISTHRRLPIQGRWQNSNTTMFRGPQGAALTALGIVADSPQPEVRALLEELAADGSLDHLRQAASAGLTVFSSDSPPDLALAAHMAQFDNDSLLNTYGTEWHDAAGALSGLGPAIVAPATACLSHEEYLVRQRAADVLSLVLPYAAEALIELGRETTDWRVLTHVKTLLADAGNHALGRLRQGRSADARSLSRTPRQVDARRGLSRGRPPEP